MLYSHWLPRSPKSVDAELVAIASPKKAVTHITGGGRNDGLKMNVLKTVIGSEFNTISAFVEVFNA